MNVWVLMGGMSAEREVSLSSGRAVAEALRERGHRVLAYELRDGVFLPECSSGETPRPIARESWAGTLLATAHAIRDRAEVAFLALHGDEGEDGTVQALLDAIDFPYTGSGPAACAVSMDKALAKRVMESLGIATPAWRLVGAAEAPPFETLPLVVKPIAEGSSVGISIVRQPGEWEPALRQAFEAPGRQHGLRRQVIVEEYVEGRELTVGVLGDRVLPVLEIKPRTGFYDYERKYTAGESEYEVPARVSPEVALRSQDAAMKLFTALGCRGMARIDFRLPPGGEPSCLELNAIPGLTSTSLVPKAAREIGIGFGELLESVCRDGLARR